MDYHVCKERRNSNPDAVVNCNNAPGSGDVDDESRTPPASSSPDPNTLLNLQVCPTTGGLFNVDISADQTIQTLKTHVSKKLGVPHDRISLLHKDRLLKEGTLTQNEITPGARITLLPNVESGLMSSPPELSVMQALKNLSEGQVNDFLTGKSPLTLAMRLGNHMMFLQLQLSTVSSSSKRGRIATPSSSTRGRQQHPPESPGTSSGSPARPPPATDSRDTCRDQLKVPPSVTPPSVMTPPPSPKSPSGGCPLTYAYPAPLSSLSTKQVTVDPSNTPPPSPCYGQRFAPDLPTIQINDQTISCVEEGDNRRDAAPAELAGQLRTCRHVAPPSTSTATTLETKNADYSPFLDNSTLSEARRSLSMKLKEFSGHSNSEKLSEPATPSGAVIESMQKLGRGVYSGTFSGTLNAALQDHEGKPKRSVSTIVHILNDLLGATPPRPGPSSVRSRSVQRQNKDTVQYNDSSRSQEENQAIRGKVQHLQMMMEERRRRRQARRQNRAAPYPSLQQTEAPPRGEPAGRAVHACPGDDGSGDRTPDMDLV